eukprot:4839104-Pleurochrysis_carterae.AAC.3
MVSASANGHDCSNMRDSSVLPDKTPVDSQRGRCRCDFRRATELDHKLYAHLGWRDDAAACGRGLGSETAKVHAQGSNEAVQGAKGNGRAGTGKSGKKMKKVKKDKGMLEKGGNGGSNEKAGKNAELGHKRALENNGCVSNSASKNLKRKKKKKN